jgi:hypothetical protein
MYLFLDLFELFKFITNYIKHLILLLVHWLIVIPPFLIKDQVVFEEFEEDGQEFGIADLIKKTIFYVAIVFFTSRPVTATSLMMIAQIGYFLLVAVRKSLRIITILTEFGNIILLVFCRIWAIDNTVNSLSPNSRLMIG